MFEAARVTDGISHTSALTGFLVGAVLGIALIAAVAFATFTCGFGVALLAGLVAGVGASALLAAGEALGKMFSSPAGSITTGSGNVFTNSLQAALVSMSTGVCSKHPPPQVVAEGSSNVFINSQPAARKGDKITCGAKISSGSGNVYIGGGTVQYLPVADEVPQWLRTAVEWAFAIAGIVGGLAGLVRVAGGLSRAMRPCAAKFIAGSVLGEVAGRYVIGPAVERVVGGLLGHPVDMTTGRKLLLAEHEIDFTLIGRLPLTCARFYASNLEHTGALGRGWVLPWEITLQWQPDNIVLRDAQGRETPFPHVPRGSGVYAPAEQRTLSCAPDGRLFLHGADELYYEFDPLDPEHLPPGGIARLRRIEDQAGHWQSYQHDNAGRLTGIRTGAGDHLLLNYAGPQGRLTQIDQVAGGTPGPLVRYEYDEAGQLIAVIDALGHTTRRFGWSGGRMAEHSDALGFSCSYTWQEQGGVARVVRMSTSAGETWTLQHDPGARRASAVDQQGRRAEWHWDKHFQVVDCTDFDASRYRVEYTDAGLPAVVHLPGGRQARTEWDEWGRPVAETDPLGRVTRTAYDGRSLRPAARQWPDGTRETAHYDPRGRLLETTDALGRRERYEYAQDSLPAARIDARGGRAELAWDARGQLTAYTDCSGRTTRYAYDADGHRVARTDAAGNRTTWQVLRDGRIAAQQSADGAQQRYEYDAAGRLCAHHDPLGRSTHWQRDARGLVTRATGPAGHELACRYDSAGRLTELSSANGAAYRYDYDAAGRVAVETRPDGVERRYRYDAAGWLRAIETLGSAQANAANASGGAGPDQDRTPLAAGRSLPPEAPRPRRRIEFERDAMGRLLASTAASAITTYRWDDMDRLREVQRQPTAAGQAQGMVADLVRFDYDRAGRLVAEHGGHGSVRYELDDLDTLAALTLPQGGRITALAYGSGHVHQLSLDDRVLCDIERDALHRRVQISQGKLSTRLGYDPLGRRLWQKTAATLPEGPAAGLAGAAAPGGLAAGGLLGAAQNGSEAARAADAGLPGLPPGPAAPLWRSYRYDPAGQLLERHDALRGHSRYEYDAAGQLISAAQGETLERFAWDAAGNLQDAIARKSAGLTTDNRLRVWQDLRFDYDAFGNVSVKKKGVGQIQHFRYDDEDRLIAVRTQNPHGISETTFTYDALGRRSARTCVTEPATAPQATYTEQRRYVWSGLRLLQDIGAGCVTTYVYDPDDDYSPLARIDQTLQPDGSLDPGAPRCYWFHTDQIGTPLELTDAEGRTAWAGRHKAWGRVDGIAPARGALEQPLRFQGQYADASTGLHYNTFRYYDPDVGRFASHDPIGIAGGENLYAYAPNPTGWVDPWAWCATALGKNMEAAGIKRPPNTTPHHIAGDTSKASLRGRNVLAKHGINADDAVNGVFLPNRANVDPAVPGILHNGRHPNAYVEAVNDRLIQASNIGGKQQVLKELDAIRRELLQAARNAKWSNIL